MKKITTHWALALITACLIIFFGFDNGKVVETIRLKQFDLLQSIDSSKVSNDIAVVTIDEKAIEKFGQYPWDRKTFGEAIEKLRRWGAGAILLPILFSEKDRLGGDKEFVEYLHKIPGVIVAQIGSNKANKNAVPRGVAKIGDPIPYMYEWDGILGPLPEIGAAASGVGVINTTPEVDGVVRRLPLIVRVGGETYPSMAIETIRVLFGQRSYQVKGFEGGIEAIRVPGSPIVKTDQNGRIWLKWDKKFENMSLAHIGESTAEDPIDLKGKIVILGATAEGISSIIATPQGEKYDWQVIGTALQTMIDGNQIVRPFWAPGFEQIALVVVALGLVFLIAFLPYWLVGTGMLVLLGGAGGVSYYAWSQHLYLIDVSMIVVALFVVGGHALFARFVKEFQLKQQIKKQFEHYLAPAMVKKLQQNPNLLKLGGDTRELTLLFCDIRGFTPISEQFKTNPQGLTVLINRFLTPMTDIIMRNDGTIDKYMGDCIMAFWNAPLEVDEQRIKAVQTSHDMLNHLEKLNVELKAEGQLPINIGIGLNTGEVVVGNMGSNQRFDYSCLGDAVNLAARLEGQSKEYGVKIVFGEDTAKEIEDTFVILELDKIAVKGKSEAVKIFTSLGTHKELHDTMNYVFAKKQHGKFLEHYRAKRWVLAEKWAQDLRSEFNETMMSYYDMMLQRIEILKEENLEDWDGVYVAKTK